MKIYNLPYRLNNNIKFCAASNYTSNYQIPISPENSDVVHFSNIACIENENSKAKKTPEELKKEVVEDYLEILKSHEKWGLGFYANKCAELEKLIDKCEPEFLNFAKIVMENSENLNIIDDIFTSYPQDKLQSLTKFLYELLNQHRKYPKNIMEKLPDLADEKDIKFLRKFYNYTYPLYEYEYKTQKNILKHINSENIDLAKKLYSYSDNPSFFNLNRIKLNKNLPLFPMLGITEEIAISSILEQTNSKTKKHIIKLMLDFDLQKKNNLDWDNLIKLAVLISELGNKADKIFKWPLKEISKNDNEISHQAKKFLLANIDFEDAEKAVKKLKLMVRKNPELYIDGDFNNESLEEIDAFFEENHFKLMLASAIFDKETIETLLRQRLYDAESYLKDIDNLSYRNLELLKSFADNDRLKHSISPTEKLEFIDLIKAYKYNKLGIESIRGMIKSGQYEPQKLKLQLLQKIMGYYFLANGEIPTNEALLKWDMNYIHKLSKELEYNEQVFRDILTLSNRENFKREITSLDGPFGNFANASLSEFYSNNLDYDKWLNPPENLNIKFKIKNKHNEQILQISNQIKEDVSDLILNSDENLQKYLKEKLLKNYIIDGNFVISEDIMTKAELEKFVQHIYKSLSGVFKRAKQNLNNPQKSKEAKHTLTIENHLQNRLKEISEIKNFGIKKNINWTIKMWDRIPQKDLFQGNYSDCCIGMGEVNGQGMIHYLTNTSYNMIEIKDNETGNVVGNALCYFVKIQKEIPYEKSKKTFHQYKTDKIGFVIDNIEINPKYRLSQKAGTELRNRIFKYAQNLTKEIAGKNIPIYLGTSHNDIPTENLIKKSRNISVLGEVDTDYDVYLDAFGGWTLCPDKKRNIILYELQKKSC